VKFGVIVFPGSNCDHDAYHVISKHVGQPVDFIWHRDTDLTSYDAVIIPGGFSYGDYLRAGALASFSPVMASVKEFAERGRLVLGICNGFQILCEAGLLPGALIRNRDLHFVCRHVGTRVETTETPFTHGLRAGEVLSLPVAHGEGNYVCDDATLEELKREDRIVFRYADPEGRLTDEANPNGSRE
jgi:phosphoribosylformylglycinamidine synthase I